jgi:guanylate kinase
MNAAEVANKIEEQKPRVVYLSGKTCTGKTTFANELARHGYSIIELDPIVTRSVVVPFGVKPGDGFLTAYRDIGSPEQTQAFIDAAKEEIRGKAKSSPVVVEGAIATSRILKEVFSSELSDFQFVYLHPVNGDVYSRRIKERFVTGAATGTSGLPKHFWEIVDERDLEHFVNTGEVNTGIEKAIDEYTKLSMLESSNRLKLFQEEFNDIQVVEI